MPTAAEKAARTRAGSTPAVSNPDSVLIGTLVTGKARPTRTGAGRPRNPLPAAFVSNLDSTLENGGTIEVANATQADVSRLRNTLLKNYKEDKEAAGIKVKTPIRCTRGKLRTANDAGTDTVNVEYWAEPVEVSAE